VIYYAERTQPTKAGFTPDGAMAGKAGDSTAVDTKEQQYGSF
jgi:hypothetical protein